MDNQKWLKRKFPKSFEEVNAVFTDEYITELKVYGYKLGKLKEPQIMEFGRKEKYPVGTYIIFKRSNPVRSYNYPLHYAITKCLIENFTASGYHSFSIYESEFEEIFE